jgi:colanic acid/amylovoran biosynthesis glycosyltransferase
MRIALFVESFPKISETFVLAHATGLLDLGHEVTIVASSRAEPDEPRHPEVSRYGLLERTTTVEGPPESVYWELPVHPLWSSTWTPGATHSVPNALRALRAAPHLARALRCAPRLALQTLRESEYGYQARSLSALHRLSSLCSLRGSFDVLHAHFGPVANGFRFARELYGAPLVAHFHGYDFSAWPKRHGAGAYARLFAEADAVIVNSSYSRGRLLALGCPSARLHRIPEPFPVAEFPFRERTLAAGEPVRLLSVGRLVEKKGIEYALDAVAQLRTHWPTLRYDVVGDGPLRSALGVRAAELGLASVVTLHGALPRNAVLALLDRAHLFVMPSVTARDGDVEGQGVALQEAQAVGLPVVATEHNGFPESIVPGRSGLLVPERDAPALARALTDLLSRPASWPEMGRAGRKHVEATYDAPRVCAELVELYGELLRSRGRIG